MTSLLPLVFALTVAASPLTSADRAKVEAGGVVQRLNRGEDGLVRSLFAGVIPAGVEQVARVVRNPCDAPKDGAMSEFKLLDSSKVEPLLARKEPADDDEFRAASVACFLLPASGHVYAYMEFDLPFPLGSSWVVVRQELGAAGAPEGGWRLSSKNVAGETIVRTTIDLEPLADGRTLYVARSTFEVPSAVPSFLLKPNEERAQKQLEKLRERVKTEGAKQQPAADPK